MIYLIGGAPRCGKTILAKRLARSKKLPYLSTDYLRPVIIRYVPKSRLGRMFPFTRLGGSENCTPEDSLRAEQTESRSMWPGIRALIEHFVQCRQDYVIEGVHLLPELVAKFKNTKFWRHIRAVYVVKTDLGKIISGFPKNKCEHDWMAGCLGNADLLDRMGRMVLLKSQYIGRGAQARGMRVEDMSGDFLKKIGELASGF